MKKLSVAVCITALVALSACSSQPVAAPIEAPVADKVPG